MTTTERRLARLKNYHTRYEVIAVKGDDTRLVLYTDQHSRNGIVNAWRQRIDAVEALVGTDVARLGHRAADGIHTGGWQIKFSGRTQRQSIQEGEHEFID